MMFLIEMVEDQGVDSCEFLKTSHLPKPLHRPFQFTEWKMRILGAVIQPATSFLFVGIAEVSHCSAVRPEFGDRKVMRATMVLH